MPCKARHADPLQWLPAQSRGYGRRFAGLDFSLPKRVIRLLIWGMFSDGEDVLAQGEALARIVGDRRIKCGVPDRYARCCRV
jgi:hypothetical protein